MRFQSILILLILFILLMNCTDYHNIEVYNNYVRYDVDGFWKADLKNENLIFRIKKKSVNNYDGTLYTFKGKSILSEMKLEGIFFKADTLKMFTNPARKVYFKGELDTSNQIITGFISSPGKRKTPFNLKRFVGQECFIVDKSREKYKRFSFRKLDEMPPAAKRYKNELDITKNYRIEDESDLNQNDILAVINRWTGDVFGANELRSKAVLLAYLLDTVTISTAQTILHIIKSNHSTEEKVILINEWTTNNLSYTQVEKVFSNLPGKDPWGFKGITQTPAQKKLLPSEMNAMKHYTGKISGKCFSLVNFITSVFIYLGVNPNDIIVFNTNINDERHAMALIKYEGKLLVVNLMMVGMLDDILKNNFKVYNVLGIYNHNFYLNENFVITQEDLERVNKLQPDQVLVPFFLSQFNLKYNFDFREPLTSKKRNNIYESIFKEYNSDNYYNLTKYAYQSLLVKHNFFYLKASLMGSHGIALAKELKTPNEIFQWINNHIRYGSIFQDDEERIMTADQVLVFQQGSNKDKGVLAYTLLRHNGYSSRVKISQNNCFVEYNNQIYDLRYQTLINKISENIIIELSE